MATIQYVSVPLLSLGSSTARLNPKLSTSPIARKNNLVGQTKSIVRRDLQRYQNHAYKNSEKIQIIFIDKMIINPQFIGSWQTHHKRVLHRMDLQEHRGVHGIENQRERRMLGNIAISKKILRTRKIMVMHSNERGECCPRTLVD